MIIFKLKGLLEEKGISMYKLSKNSGVRPNTISEWVNDSEATDKDNKVKSINRDTLNSICKAMNCTVNDLIEYVEDEQSKDL